MALSLPPIPSTMAHVPLDDRGYPIPWFAAYIGGKPDFRVVGPGKPQRAYRDKLCWICGKPLEFGMPFAFVAGPMCAINRTSAEPPSHIECATFAAQACPFLVLPKAKRREANLPEHEGMPGTAIMRNPGVTVVWHTNSFRLFSDGKGGMLFEMGEPVKVDWYAEARAATREECQASIDSGVPSLFDLADKGGSDHVLALTVAINAVQDLLPAVAA